MLKLVLVLAFISVVSSDPIIIRSGVSTHKDEGKQAEANNFDLNSAKGVTDYQNQEGQEQNNEGKHVLAQDSGKFAEETAQKAAHNNAKNFADEKHHQSEGGNVADFNNKSAAKKGHHKSGYTKSFRKDESASSSSYYDDADDEGNAYVADTKKNLYGDKGHDVYRGAGVEDKHYAENQGKQGVYHNAGNYDKDIANGRGYHQRKYYDAHENEGRRKAADRYNHGGTYEDEKYLKKSPHYYDPPYYRPTRKTITIYEDPRYDGYEKYPASYSDDYVQLELKRPPRDYDYRDYYRDYRDRRYDRRPSYDYY